MIAMIIGQIEKIGVPIIKDSAMDIFGSGKARVATNNSGGIIPIKNTSITKKVIPTVKTALRVLKRVPTSKDIVKKNIICNQSATFPKKNPRKETSMPPINVISRYPIIPGKIIINRVLANALITNFARINPVRDTGLDNIQAAVPLCFSPIIVLCITIKIPNTGYKP